MWFSKITAVLVGALACTVKADDSDVRRISVRCYLVEI